MPPLPSDSSSLNPEDLSTPRAQDDPGETLLPGDDSRTNVDETQQMPAGKNLSDDLGETCPLANPGTEAEIAAAETIGFDSEMQVEAAKIKVQKIGSYEIRGVLGRGGMGVVYQAWQESANRLVALKVIRKDRLLALPRSLQEVVIDRFQHEAQAAGRLEHDHIVTIYEVGEDNGEHFFSMRYVEGKSLFELLHDGPLPGKQAAQYLEPVARALHDAHQHGILHRDLKPQNILIDNKTQRALVADFGIAKLAEQAEQAAAMTQVGEVIGTPAYMSPEQATDSSGVTAKSDVYSLGATLYHTLVGSPPFSATSVIEIIRQVSDREAKPLREINPAIDRDLETIVHKCIEKDPTKRYGSAEALADDLSLYLRGEPISARPVSSLERLARVSRRNPWLTGATVAAVGFLVIAVVIAFIGWRGTSQALQLAQTETNRAKAALLEADTQRERAEKSFDTLKAAIDQFFVKMSEDELKNQPGMQEVRKELLEDAAAYYQQFLTDRSDDPSLKDELALAHFRIGTVKQLIDSKEEAIKEFSLAFKIQSELLAKEPENIAYLVAIGDTANSLATLRHETGKLDDAGPHYEQAIDYRSRVVNLAPSRMEHLRKLANAKMNYGTLALDLAVQNPTDYSQQLETAKARFLEAQSIRQDVDRNSPNYWMVARDLGRGCFNLSDCYLEEQDFARAETECRQAINHFSEAMSLEPSNLDIQFMYATCLRLYGDLLAQRADTEMFAKPVEEHWNSFRSSSQNVMDNYDQAVIRAASLVDTNPKVADYRSMLASIHMNAGFFMFNALDIPQYPTKSSPVEDLEEFIESAGNHFNEAAFALELLVKDYPENPRYRRDFAFTLLVSAELAERNTSLNNRYEVANDRAARAREQFGELLLNSPSNQVNQQSFADAVALEVHFLLRQTIEKFSSFGG
jgi:serine/threonine protein kinase/tetratricopeptide (TPR) repeat protein